MSKFLGPIHHWLFNKIKLYEELEEEIIKNVQGNLDVDLSDITTDINEKIGYPVPKQPLESLIDTNNIHGWLQNKITIAETRQATLITKLINKYGEKALLIIQNTYKNQAIECGKDASEKYDVYGAQELYKALNNYILDGMPCDNVNNITFNEENRLEWKVVNCLHKGYWEKANGDLNVLYKLRENWISNFVENANPEFKYDFSVDEINGQKTLVHRIYK